MSVADLNMAFAQLTYRETTAAQAIAAENDPINPWTAVPRPRTGQYFTIREKARELPAAATRQEFLELYQREQVIILTGDTGSGKTTQIPQFVMYADLPETTTEKVVCTQPRRIAAREVARRVATELDVELGKEVGYSFRHEDNTCQLTRLVYATDGRLFKEMESDPLLNKYTCVIVDEAHERTASTDLLLGFIRNILPLRKDLNLIVMSATMRAKIFQAYFKKAPIFKIPGRTFPVDILHIGGDGRVLPSIPDFVSGALRVVLHIVTKPMPGDILIFVPGEFDVKALLRELGAASPLEDMAMFPLHGNMTKAEQDAALSPDPRARRKCIVATNIAETSLTVDGIVHVIDTGLEKGMSYNARLRLWMLMVEPISQASAKQRAGRAGRTQAGTCWRLYSNNAYGELLIKDPLPGLLRGDMFGPILDILAIGGHAGSSGFWNFPFIDRPSPEVMLGSCEFGRKVRSLPLEPRHSAAIIRAVEMEPYPVWEVTAIMCLLNEENIFLRPDLAEYADIVRERFSSARGDHFTMLNVWHAFQHELQACKDMGPEDRGNHLDRWCIEHYLNSTGMQDAKLTFEQIVEWLNKSLNSAPEPAPLHVVGTPRYYETFNRVLLRASFTSIAVKDPRDRLGQTYLRLEDNQAALVHPASSIARGHKYDFVYYDKFIDHRKPYFTTATGFDSQWLFEDSVVSVHIKRLLDQPPESSDKWASLRKLRLAHDKFKRGMARTAEAASDAQVSES